MDGDGTTDTRERVLAFWWMLELFNPQRVPTVTPRTTPASERQVIAWRAGEPLPWESPPDLRPLSGGARVWRHTVYLGVYPLSSLSEAVARAFGSDPEAYDSAPDGESACAGILIDHEGRLVTGSPVLSSAVWAAARATGGRSTDPGRMTGFERAAARFGEDVDAHEGTRRAAARSDRAVVHDAQSIGELLELARQAADVAGTDSVASDRVVIMSTPVSARRANDGTDIDFLNSFFLEDLAKTRASALRGVVGEGLASYLRDDIEAAASNRIDVVDHPQAVDRATAATRIPRGRWPADARHALALSQQLAVNTALLDLGARTGLIGVNGPPGTGKTTMLRDILAGNVVERARRLAMLRLPQDAFTDVTHRWSDGDGHARIVRQLRPELTGYEMVVASSNNTAVENVSAEVPDRTAIAEPWRSSADYFGSIATRVLNGSAASGEGATRSPATAWGLVAARLGRKQHRAAFTSAFWFDEPSSKDAHPSDTRAFGMQTRLSRWRDGLDTRVPWQRAREEFATAAKRVDALLTERSEAESRIALRAKLAEDAQGARGVIAEGTNRASRIRHVLAQFAPALRDGENRCADAAERRRRHLAARPSVLETLFSFGRVAREWRAPLVEIDAALDAADHDHRAALRKAEQLEQTLNRVEANLTVARDALERAERRQTGLRAACARDEKRFADAYPGAAWRGDQRELRAAWLDEELDAARSDLFIAALRLHQDFLSNAAADMCHGLRAAVEVIGGNAPPDLEPEKLLAAWQLFFLAVPMVSTTFASAGRMFGALGADSIGWLLIDEAGQAAPQCAVGAIWRAQRTIAVGDPLQLEPVVTLPQTAQRAIARAFGLSSTWIPPRTSVQTLADRVTPLGTMLDNGEGHVWVGAPLRVHRRCDDPMFTLCNRIAYNDLMVNGVQRVIDDPEHPDLFDSPDGPVIAASHWAEERSATPGSHLQSNQIKRLERALDYLGNHGVAPSDVIAISPFRDVADRLRGLSRTRYPGLRAGTIHTAQGREASVVILVLGGDPNKPGAAANWARTPNLVNVAASRAQRRLYVIGDSSLWGVHGYFRSLHESLSH